MAMEFQPHAVILTERSVPQPIFVAAIIGSGYCALTLI